MPPLRHLVFFQFLASSTAEQQQAVARALSELPSVIPDILYFKVVPAAPQLYPTHKQLNPGYSLLIDSIFASAHALSVYAPHPAHQGVISKYISPIRSDTFVIDFQLSERFNLDAWKQMQRRPHVRHLVMYKAKAEHSGEEEAMSKELEQLQVPIPGILSTLSGQQRLADLYDGYGDRSKGIVNVVDLLFKDQQAMETYDTHPAHVEFVHKNLPKWDAVVTFDYECAE